MSGFSHTGIIRRVADYQAAAGAPAGEVILSHLRLDLHDWDLAGLSNEVEHIVTGLTALGERGLATVQFLRDTTGGVRRLFWIEVASAVSDNLSTARIQARIAHRLTPVA